jgi:hypothetical protein
MSIGNQIDDDFQVVMHGYLSSTIPVSTFTPESLLELGSLTGNQYVKGALVLFQAVTDDDFNSWIYRIIVELQGNLPKSHFTSVKLNYFNYTLQTTNAIHTYWPATNSTSWEWVGDQRVIDGPYLPPGTDTWTYTL